MRICVLGLWHLGAVTAACLAEAGHTVAGLDFDANVIHNLQQGVPPLFEPGLEELLSAGISSGRLTFTTDIQTAVETFNPQVIWVTYDTPVDDEDHADVQYVVERVSRLFPYLKTDMLVLISSQAPVGTTRKFEQSFAALQTGQQVHFGYSPENLRLGKAIQVFTRPDRFVVGVRTARAQGLVEQVLHPITERIEWMSIESAEMTKHALNAFLATSVTFANEIATLCEAVGADAKEVERGLKSEARIGPKAYLSPGGAFAGGTLARDIAFLSEIADNHDLPIYLLPSVKQSNDVHKKWPQRRLSALLGNLNGKRVAVWGLTYKPGTNTLRRSSSVELCEWLAAQGAIVQAHDPAIQALPAELAHKITLCTGPEQAIERADALVVATEWPEYLQQPADLLVQKMARAAVIDANRFLAKTIAQDARINYFSVGKS